MAHSAIPHIVVTTWPIQSYSFQSAVKFAYLQRLTWSHPIITAIFHLPLANCELVEICKVTYCFGLRFAIAMETSRRLPRSHFTSLTQRFCNAVGCPLFNRLMCTESNWAYRLGSEKKRSNTPSQVRECIAHIQFACIGLQNCVMSFLLLDNRLYNSSTFRAK